MSDNRIVICTHVESGIPADVVTVEDGHVHMAVCSDCAWLIEHAEKDEDAERNLLPICREHAGTLGVPVQFKAADGFQIRNRETGGWRYQAFCDGAVN